MVKIVDKKKQGLGNIEALLDGGEDVSIADEKCR